MEEKEEKKNQEKLSTLASQFEDRHSSDLLFLKIINKEKLSTLASQFEDRHLEYELNPLDKISSDFLFLKIIHNLEASKLWDRFKSSLSAVILGAFGSENKQ